MDQLLSTWASFFYTISYNVNCQEKNRRLPPNNPCVHRAAPSRAVELGPAVMAGFCCLLAKVCCGEDELHQLNSSCAPALGCRHGHCLPSLAHGQSWLEKTNWKEPTRLYGSAHQAAPKLLKHWAVAKFSVVPCFFVVLLWSRKGCAVGFSWGNGENPIQIQWLVSLCSQWGERNLSRMCYLLDPSVTGGQGDNISVCLNRNMTSVLSWLTREWDRSGFAHMEPSCGACPRACHLSMGLFPLKVIHHFSQLHPNWLKN